MGSAASIRRYEKSLAGDLLKGVSRSFYLSLRLLPGELRGPVSLGYLLARASDTVADAAGLEAETRLRWLDRLADRVSGQGEEGDWQRLAREVAPHTGNGGEKKLIGQLPACLEWLDALEAPAGPEVRGVLGEIIRGQSLDVERFPEATELRALQNSEELNEYTYLVAGSVGRFWTALCFSELGEECALEAQPVMVERGIAYGDGLQLVNILRDLPRDLDAGRCYLPEDELRADGLTLRRAREEPEALLEISRRWEEECAACLGQGLAYVESLRPRRLRLATALPMLFGVRTLALIREGGWEERRAGIKITRGEVKRVMARAAIAAATRHELGELYRELGGDR